MKDFHKHGFFADSARDFRDTIIAKHPALWSESIALNTSLQQLQYRLSIHRESQLELIAAALFARSLSTFQGFLILAERGMIQQAKMLIRCMLETVFPLVALSADVTFLDRIIGSEELERLKGINKLIRYWERSGDQSGQLDKARVLAAQVKAEVDRTGARKMSIFDSAKKAGLEDWYDTVYSLLSNTVHSSLRSLDDHVEVDDDGRVEAIINEPSLANLDKYYIAAVEGMLHAVRAIGQIFSENVEDLVEGTAARIQTSYAAIQN